MQRKKNFSLGNFQLEANDATLKNAQWENFHHEDNRHQCLKKLYKENIFYSDEIMQMNILEEN